MTDSRELFDDAFKTVLQKATSPDPSTEAATTAIKNLKILSECRPPEPEPEPSPTPITRRGKLLAAASSAWDNETTRVLIKSGGAFAGVALVAWTTIRKDHIIERQALSQATQRSN